MAIPGRRVLGDLPATGCLDVIGSACQPFPGLPTGFLRFYGLTAHSDRAWRNAHPREGYAAAARCLRGPGRHDPLVTARQKGPQRRPGHRPRFPDRVRSDRGDVAGPRPALVWLGRLPLFARRDVPEQSARRRGSRPRHQQSVHCDGCPKLAPSVVWQEPDFLSILATGTDFPGKAQ